MSYVPPHLRRKAAPPNPASGPKRSSLSALAQAAAVKTSDNTKQTIEPKKPNDAEDALKKEDEHNNESKRKKEVNADLESKESVMIQNFYSMSPVYQDWSRVRQEAYDNVHISKFFEKKRENSKLSLDMISSVTWTR